MFFAYFKRWNWIKFHLFTVRIFDIRRTGIQYGAENGYGRCFFPFKPNGRLEIQNFL